mmetsp:Transcript_24606/g.77659  ORF Transcript_24606/g.77659 Transcript_24606/m.77659 type:complete len:182 (-) Transcript_24606:624-1169(-)
MPRGRNLRALQSGACRQQGQRDPARHHRPQQALHMHEVVHTQAASTIAAAAAQDHTIAVAGFAMRAGEVVTLGVAPGAGVAPPAWLGVGVALGARVGVGVLGACCTVICATGFICVTWTVPPIAVPMLCSLAVSSLGAAAVLIFVTTLTLATGAAVTLAVTVLLDVVCNALDSAEVSCAVV